MQMLNERGRVAAAALAAVLVIGSMAGCSDDRWEFQTQAPTAESLLNISETQNRYMSLPDSRVVVNPFNFESQSTEVTQSQYSNRDTMPLNFGFCDPFKGESRGIELPDAMMMASGTPAAAGEVETLWEGDLSEHGAWRFSGTGGLDYMADFKGETDSLTVTENAETAWQHMEAPVELDDMADAYLTVTVDSIGPEGGRFAIKVTDYNTPSDITLIETGIAGTYTFSLAEATGWTGAKSLWVKIFSVGNGCTVTLSDIRILKGNAVYDAACDYATTWRPDQLGFTASYPNGVQITGTDFFYDEKTVVRDMAVTGEGSLLLYGKFSGTASVEGHTIRINCGTFQYAVTLSEEVQPVFYETVVGVLAGSEGVTDPADGSVSVWAYRLDAVPESGKVRVAFAFDTKEAAAEDVVALSRAPGDDCEKKLAQRTEQWDELLSRVPRPGTFELTDIDAMGVTADQVKQSYYEAWVQVMDNALPASPEIDYPYRSFATGKASLWGYGSPKCSYSATWEALYGMSYYAQIDADAAWEMYRGLMSLVDETGMIAGESLPPNNARVAWILYTVKPDKEALAEIQPELTRHLQWRFENPRWIYLNATPDTQQKDLDFVAAAMVDVRYLMRINEELGLESENAGWEKTIDETYDNMLRWFFPDHLPYPVQIFTYNGNQWGEGSPLWVAKALHVPDMRQEEIDDIMRLFKAKYAPSLPFGGLPGTKYESYIYTVWGLMEHGYVEYGRAMSQSAIRDIIRAGVHSEGYIFTQVDGEMVPQPQGVRPSMFGVALMIDNVYLMNGVRMDDGMPAFANYFDHDGGVENLTVDGKTFHFRKTGNTYTYGGSYVGVDKTLEVKAEAIGFPFENTHVHPLHGTAADE